MSYRVNFVRTCLEDIAEANNEDIKKLSLAHRISRLENEDYVKILKLEKSSGSGESIEVNHEANIKQALGH
jgi:hypothetical protein